MVGGSSRRRALVAGVALLAVLAGPASADVVLPGTRDIDHEVFLELHPELDWASYQIAVREGDTLRGIAQKRLGDEERWTELAELNQIEDPKGIQPGQLLRVPPKDEEHPEKHHVLYGLVTYPFCAPELLTVGTPLPYFKDSFVVIAVKDGHIDQFREVCGETRGFGVLKCLKESLAKDEQSWFTVSEMYSVNRNVRSLSSVRSARTRWELQPDGLGDGLQLRVVESKRFGAGGKEVTKADEIFGRRSLLAGFGGFGVVGLALVLRRRRRKPDVEIEQD